MDATKFLAYTVLLLVRAVHSSPIEQELVDLSYVYDNSTLGFPNETPFRLAVTHNGTTDQGVWLQSEEFETATHWGTHIDAPCHFVKGGWTLEDIPLKHFIAPAAVVDITDRAAYDPDALLEVSDLEHWERRWKQTLDGTIVVVRSGWGSRWPDREAYTGTLEKDISKLRFPGVSGEAAKWLVDNRKIYGLGIDTPSLDSGANFFKGVPAHQALLGGNVYGLENVANLHKLPGCGAKLQVSPMRLGGDACGSPTRIIAVLP